MSLVGTLTIFCGIFYCLQFDVVAGFGKGPPVSTCLTLFPKHGGQEAQTTNPPFTITIQENEYSPGQDIHIKVKGNNGRQFKGTQLAAHRSHGDIEEFLGEFTEYPTDKMKTLNCIGGKRNVVIHQNNDLVPEVNVTWKAPAINEGNITFHISVVESYDVFWINIVHTLPSKVNIPVVPVLQVQADGDINIAFDQCGQSQGCFLYPKFCSGSNCDVFASFRDEGGDRVRFQMFARNAEGYISIGFSDDKKMANDHTISCTINEDEYTVQHGYNPRQFNYRQYKKNYLKDMAVAMKDGKLYCEFTRPKAMSVVNMFNDTEMITFDINKEYYVMIAWGFTHRGSAAITHHTELPVTTSSKVNFQANKIYGGSSLPNMTKIHALLMMIAWILFTGLATIIARHFKSSFGQKMTCGSKIWFQAHRTSAVVAALLTATSFVIIFVKVDGLTQVAETHGYVGIALMSVTLLQVVAGILRPDPESNLRSVFNWGHWFMGKSAHILSAVSIFLAFNINIISEKQRTFGIAIASVWVVCQLLWEIFYEIRKRRRESPEGKEKMKVHKADIVLLIIYIINMLIVLIVSILAVYIF